MTTYTSADTVIIKFDHDRYRGFGFWWNRLMLVLISGMAGVSVGIGLVQYYR